MATVGIKGLMVGSVNHVGSALLVGSLFMHRTHHFVIAVSCHGLCRHYFVYAWINWLASMKHIKFS